MKSLVKIVKAIVIIWFILLAIVIVGMMILPESTLKKFEQVSDEEHGNVTTTQISTTTEVSTTAQPTTAETTTTEGTYIFPNSDKEYLNSGDVSNLSSRKIRLARNEIFARHGYIFNSSDLKKYFGSQSWYKPEISGENFDESVLNKYEKANIDLLKSYENNGSSSGSNIPTPEGDPGDFDDTKYTYTLLRRTPEYNTKIEVAGVISSIDATSFILDIDHHKTRVKVIYESEYSSIKVGSSIIVYGVYLGGEEYDCPTMDADMICYTKNLGWD